MERRANCRESDSDAWWLFFDISNENVTIGIIRQSKNNEKHDKKTWLAWLWPHAALPRTAANVITNCDNVLMQRNSHGCDFFFARRRYTNLCSPRWQQFRNFRHPEKIITIPGTHAFRRDRPKTVELAFERQTKMSSAISSRLCRSRLFSFRNLITPTPTHRAMTTNFESDRRNDWQPEVEWSQMWRRHSSAGVCAWKV